MRIGFGYDVHAFEEGRKLMLCGVEVDYHMGLKGHSDADVAVHALSDAMLGAAALGDIGQHFPDSSPSYKNIDSIILLRKVRDLAAEKGYKIVNVDITIVAQEPKLSPYMERFTSRLSEVLETSADNVNIKATTEENMGFTGNLSGVKAYAVCLMDKIH